jgi:hypothetical protein
MGCWAGAGAVTPTPSGDEDRCEKYCLCAGQVQGHLLYLVMMIGMNTNTWVLDRCRDSAAT